MFVTLGWHANNYVGEKYFGQKSQRTQYPYFWRSALLLWVSRVFEIINSLRTKSICFI